MSDPFLSSRRTFLGGTALLAAAAFAPKLLAETREKPAAGSPVVGPAARSDLAGGHFPADFWWGAATASYQIEGAAAEEGRTPSIWDTFSKTPGKTLNGDTGDVACDHYHRMEEDLRLMAELGVKHYRFSISWSRVLPQGRGAVNEKGVDFYKRLCDTLQKHGITPHATLYHWDLPQALQDAYAGWENERVVDDFADYSSLMAGRLGDRVKHWLTLNEIQSFAARGGYGVDKPGKHAPGIQLASKQLHRQLVHRVLLAHGKACQALRAASPGHCSVGLAENYSALVPLIETPEHVAAARKAFVEDESNGAILMPLLTGRYPEAWLEARRDSAPRFTEAEMRLIAQPLDILGFNCYSGTYVRAAATPAGYERVPSYAAYPKMNISWLNHVPESIYWGTRLVGETTGLTRLPIFITENGCPDGNQPLPSGLVLDTDRIMYLRAYLRNVQRAAAEGYPIVGYFPWSFMDNYEWAEGYAKRFGLVRVDYDTQRRTPKASYEWYQSVIRASRVL